MTTSKTSGRETTGPVLQPADLREAHEALAGSVGQVHVRGGGTADGWADALRPAPVTVDTTRLTGILAYNPADMTVAVRAGTPLADLQRELAGNRQRVAFDAARVRRGATVGGLIATADSGPLALAYGSLRDLVIGATLVLADGTIARTGGHVIKNVAGYDLAKVTHGSYGALGLLAEVVLRLHPVPAASVTVRLPCSLAAAAERAAELASTSLEPVAVEWYGSGVTEGHLLVRLEGTAEGTEARARAVAELLGPGAFTVRGDEADAAWREHADLVDQTGNGAEAAVLRIGCRPSRLPGVLARIDPPGTGVTAGLLTGIATVTVPAEPAGVAVAHTAVTAAGGTSVLRHHPATAELPAWGQAPSAVAVLRALKKELDPDTRLAPGRFGAWFTGNTGGEGAR
ncbi:FAD-binding oxidoreductase [Gandjariella thermophila]|uniref:FAD-linked oxidase n=1 Tax=Gandjariella thermophila TaxID=1931992 RepID=A0A4D4JAD0_9PSEU|nr:FAD-binding protein [Gandjariella thermophila]GDY32524.1 FAD-linked oxidase [Gandjariella thermophila]